MIILYFSFLVSWIYYIIFSKKEKKPLYLCLLRINNNLFIIDNKTFWILYSKKKNKKQMQIKSIFFWKWFPSECQIKSLVCCVGSLGRSVGCIYVNLFRFINYVRGFYRDITESGKNLGLSMFAKTVDSGRATLNRTNTTLGSKLERLIHI